MHNFGEIIGQWGIAVVLLAAMICPPLVAYWLIVRGIRLMSDNNNKLYAAHVETAGNLDKSPWLTLNQWRIMELGLKEAKKQGKIVDYVKVTKDIE